MYKAVFIDRDGTLIKDVGYLSDINDIELIKDSDKAIRKFHAAGYKVFMITNQAAIAKNIISDKEFNIINDKILSKFSSLSAGFDGVYYCPHHPTEGFGEYKIVCDCRKPSPGLILKAAKEHDVDLKKSFMIGDKKLDIEAGKNAGCSTILVKTGYGAEVSKETGLKSDYIAEDILHASSWILKEGGIK